MHMNAQKCYREKTPRIPGKNPTYPGGGEGEGESGGGDRGSKNLATNKSVPCPPDPVMVCDPKVAVPS